ncbi:MAG: C4-dicarboxylate-specific signal transduction histidine kinase, partial [Thermoproteota archaeon]
MNLLNNSFDAISKMNPPWSKVQIIAKDKTVLIQIIDSGNGMPEDLREKVLKQFCITKEIGKAAGLRLSVSKGNIEDHKGSLYIDKNCENTTFCILLPRA